jgi:hypothetical protein
MLMLGVVGSSLMGRVEGGSSSLVIRGLAVRVDIERVAIAEVLGDAE